jgi:acyl-CoA synthetase (AMP-forming)/AMP-acid ligase II
VLSHATFSGKLAANQRRLQFGPNESLLHLLHLNFSFGQWTSLLTLATGGQLHLVQRFDPAAAVKRLAASRVDRVPVVPSMLRLMLPLVSATENRRRLAEVASPGVWIAGGEPLSAGIGRRYRKSLPHAEMADVFGLSESATSDFVVTPAEYDAAAGTIGRPAEGVEAMVADQDGKPMPPGEFGELCLRTRFLMTGYLGDPDATRETIRSGWLRTGDLARIRSDNRFELGGRTKNLISRGGIKISPLEIESVYAEHPACAGVLAVGAPDDVLGERIHLLVVPSTSEGITLDAMRRWGRNHLEPYKLPDEIHLVNAIPLGNTGKADRLAAASLISGRNPAQS